MKIYKVALDFRRAMSYLLNDGLEGKDMINGLMRVSETYLSPISERSLLKLTSELHVENRSIALRERVTHHDRPIVVGILTWGPICVLNE
jgi:hypothetical protein